MGQAADGTMVELTEETGKSFLKHGSLNLAMVGDVFKVRGCNFVIEAISKHGLSAKGISEQEYEQKKQRML